MRYIMGPIFVWHPQHFWPIINFMIICVCRNITKEDLEKAAEKHSFDTTQVLQELGVGSDCGICLTSALESLKAGTLKAEAATKTDKKS